MLVIIVGAGVQTRYEHASMPAPIQASCTSFPHQPLSSVNHTAGHFINTLITFLIICLVVFFAIGEFQQQHVQQQQPLPPPPPPQQQWQQQQQQWPQQRAASGWRMKLVC